MGVIYKLKQEVVDFIVNEKKANPKVSCRDLADIVSEKYQLQVSKSSVNSVLKTSQLSSPVGRRSKTSKKQKFQLPPNKKNLLFGGTQPTPQIAPPAPPELEPGTNILDLIDKKAETKKLKATPPLPKENLPVIVNSTDEITLELNIPLPLPVALPEKPISIEKIEPPSSPLLLPFLDSPESEKIQEGAGFFILKAAEWELASEPILAKLLTKFINPNSSWKAEEIQDITEIFMLSEVLDRSFSNLNAHQIMEMGLLKADKYFDEHSFNQFLSEILDPKGYSLKVANEIPFLFTEIAEVRLFWENSILSLDPNFRKFNVQTGQKMSLYKTLNYVTQQFITNVQTINLLDDSTDPISIENLKNLEQNFMKLKKISIFDAKGQELASFSTIPQKRRNFIYAKPLNNSGITDNGFSRKGSVVSKVTHESFYYTEPDHLFENCGLRGIRLSASKDGASQDILLATNIDKEVSIEKIVGEYLERRSFLNPQVFKDIFDKSTRLSFDFYQKTLQERNKSLFDADIPDFKDNCFIFLKALHEFCQRHFFPEECLGWDFSTGKTRFYQLPGAVIHDKRYIKVYLSPPYDYEYKDYLLTLALRINACNVKDPSGRRLLFYINR